MPCMAVDFTAMEEVIMEQLEVTQCQHHWVLEDPSGPTSKGQCQKCGAVKDFAVELKYGSYKRYPKSDGAAETSPQA